MRADNRMSSTSKVTLRDATEDDAGDVALLLGELGYPADPSDIPARMRAVREEGGAVVLAVDEDGSALGLMGLARHATLHSPSPAAYVTALVTAENARRRGVGRMLVEEAKRWARETGCERLSLTSAEHRNAAHGFYPSCGLPYTGRRFSAIIHAPGTQ
jgi:GNAT superfamily N-acetyltransferase